jgi:hypothetical protein
MNFTGRNEQFALGFLLFVELKNMGTDSYIPLIQNNNKQLEFMQ